jgi:hypothetical protein
LWDSKDYFQEKSLSFSKLQRKYNWIALSIAGLGLVAPIVGFIAVYFGTPESIEHLVHTIAAILMGWAALSWSYSERRGWGQLARQYARMYRVFSSAEDELNKFESAGDFEFCRLTIFELGCNALAENAEWLVTHRERKLSLKMLVG